MGEFIAKYWLEVLFGLIVAGLGFFVRHYYSLWKKEQETIQAKMVADIKEEVKNSNQETLAELRASNLTTRQAILEVQGKQFKADCQRLLEIPNGITFEQFENISLEYKIYKSLGGNGLGEALYNMVQEKYSMQMIQKDQIDLINSNLHPTESDIQPSITKYAEGCPPRIKTRERGQSK